MAIHGVAELVGDGVLDGAAEAFAGKGFGHGLSPFPDRSLYMPA
jgi:hypothetical protein